MYVASPTRFASDYRRFATPEEAFQAAQANGWGIRMSGEGGGSASLIKPESCEE
jgi:hypothetical protein